MRFMVYHDGQHGWIRVRRPLLAALGIEDKISRFSYQRGSWAYLEIDCDAGIFSDAWNSKSLPELQFCHKYANRDSKIRSYESYRSQSC